jgi:hypothetical protein
LLIPSAAPSKANIEELQEHGLEKQGMLFQLSVMRGIWKKIILLA